MKESRLIHLTDLGRKEYKETWDMQEAILKENLDVKAGARDQGIADPDLVPTKHQVLLVEHPPVYTLGKSGHMENVLISEDEQREKGISFFKINRGGDITFHGPGQLVGYPILDLEKFYTDIGKYLRNLEEVVIRVLDDYGLKGERSPGETGVWLDASVKGMERKICAMGVRCSRWITMHGFAFNVNTDLSYFNYIVPCGIQDKQVTSLQKELGRDLDMEEVKSKWKHYFSEVFEVEYAESTFA
ncbi:MAG: lipoyl(octanoyl) transferase LipB [Chitinophagaceae bacterium]